MAIAPGTRLGPYEIVALIGAGAMGEVYRARDARLARDVAIKVLPASFAADAERLQRFETEARAAGTLNHPNIVAVFDTGVADGVPYVVEELLEGETLRQLLDHGPLSARRATDYAAQVARGLAAANDRGIVHRDLKPENLFVTRDGRAKILDFGLAKVRADVPGSGSPDSLTVAATAAGMVLGTAGYMAPEQVRGEAADHRSDLFALGIVMYEMLGGAKPFSRGTAVDTMHAILHADPPELTGVPPALARIVWRCLEKEPARRFQSAHDLAFALEALSDSSGVVPAPALRAALRPGAPLARMLVGAAIVAAALLGWFVGAGRPPKAPKFTRLTFRTGSITAARFLADGKSAAFDAAWDGEAPEIFQVPFDFPSARPLNLKIRQLLAASSTDELALQRGKPAKPWFPNGGVLENVKVSGGSPRAVLDSIGFADYSPDGSALAIVRFTSTRALLEYPVGHVLLSTDLGIAYPRVSRDGRTVAVLVNPLPNDDRGYVALVDAAGHLRRVTKDFESVSGLAWSADGTEVWFAASESGIHRSIWSVHPGRPARERLSAPTGLFICDISRAGDALVLRESIRNIAHARMAGDSAERDLSWFDYSVVEDLSADGKVMLFDEESESAGALYAACMRRADDPAPVRLGDGIPVALSPDGAWAASFVPTSPPRVMLLPTGPGTARTLDTGPISGLITGATWTADGAHLLVTGTEANRPPRLWMLDAAGGKPEPVSPEGYGFGVRGVRRLSPDGRTVLCSGPDGKPGLFDLRAQLLRPLSWYEGDMQFLGWSADGKGLLVLSRALNPSPVTLVDPATGARRELFRIRRAPWENIITVRVAADLRSYAYTTSSVLDDLYLMRGLR